MKKLFKNFDFFPFDMKSKALMLELKRFRQIVRKRAFKLPN